MATKRKLSTPRPFGFEKVITTCREQLFVGRDRQSDVGVVVHELLKGRPSQKLHSHWPIGPFPDLMPGSNDQAFAGASMQGEYCVNGQYALHDSYCACAYHEVASGSPLLTVPGGAHGN